MAHSPTMKRRKKDNMTSAPPGAGAKMRSFDRDYNKGRRSGGPFGK
jgi:hypothetical protein